MTRATPGSINITRNPVTLWEDFNYSVNPSMFSGYKDDDRADGGFWGSSFKIHDREVILREMFERGLGRDIKAWGYGLTPLHEGMVYEMVYNLPPDQYVTTLASVLNKIWMRSDYDGDNQVERSTELSSVASIARFGTIERVVSGGQLEGLTVADQAVQTYLDIRAWPKTAVNKGAGVGRPYLEIVSKGYIHTLAWLTYNFTTPGTQGMSAQWSDVVANAEFVAGTEISTNATSVNKVVDADRKILDIALGLGKLGDNANNRWVMYMKFGRILVLKQAAPVSVAVL